MLAGAAFPSTSKALTQAEILREDIAVQCLVTLSGAEDSSILTCGRCASAAAVSHQVKKLQKVGRLQALREV